MAAFNGPQKNHAQPELSAWRDRPTGKDLDPGMPRLDRSM